MKKNKLFMKCVMIAQIVLMTVALLAGHVSNVLIVCFAVSAVCERIVDILDD